MTRRRRPSEHLKIVSRNMNGSSATSKPSHPDSLEQLSAVMKLLTLYDVKPNAVPLLERLMDDILEDVERGYL